MEDSEEGGREGGERSQREWPLFLQVVYVCVQADTDVLFKVVWVTAACSSGLHDLANATAPQSKAAGKRRSLSGFALSLIAQPSAVSKADAGVIEEVELSQNNV